MVIALIAFIVLVFVTILLDKSIKTEGVEELKLIHLGILFLICAGVVGLAILLNK